MTDARIEAATLALLHSDNYDMPEFSDEDLQKALTSAHHGDCVKISCSCMRCLCEQALSEASSILAAADDVDPLTKIEGVLWCVTVAGPDEVHAVQDYATGVRKARELNEWLERNNKKDEYAPIIYALIDEWPWDAESHAKDIVRQEQEEASIVARREKQRIAELEGGGNG